MQEQSVSALVRRCRAVLPLFTRGTPNMSLQIYNVTFDFYEDFDAVVEGIHTYYDDKLPVEEIEKEYTRALRLYMMAQQKEEELRKDKGKGVDLDLHPRITMIDDYVDDAREGEASGHVMSGGNGEGPSGQSWFDKSTEHASREVFKGVDRILITKKGEIRSLGITSDDMTKKSTEVWFVRERNTEGFGSLVGWMFVIPQRVSGKKRQILLPLTHLYNAQAKWEKKLKSGAAIKIDDDTLKGLQGVRSLQEVKTTFASMVSDKKDFGYWDSLSPFAPSPIASRSFFFDFWTVKDKPPAMKAEPTTDITELLSRLDSMGLALTRWEEDEPSALDMRTLFKWLFTVGEFLTHTGKEVLSTLILSVWIRWKHKGDVSHLPGVLRSINWPLGKKGSPSQRLDIWVAGIRKGQSGLQNPKCFTEQGLLKRIKARLEKKNLKMLEDTQGKVSTPSIEEALTFEKLRVPEKEDEEIPVFSKVTETVEEVVGSVKSSIHGTFQKVKRLLTFRRAIVDGVLTKTYNFFCLPWTSEVREGLREDPNNTWVTRVLSYPKIWALTQKKRVHGIQYALNSKMGWKKFFLTKGKLVAALALSPITGILEWLAIPWF